MLNHLIPNNCVQVVFLSLPIVIYSPFAREGVFSALCMISHVTFHYCMLSTRELVFKFICITGICCMCLVDLSCELHIGKIFVLLC